MKKLLLLPLLLIGIINQPLFAVEMELTRLDGKKDQLSDYLGKWVIVNYWATWCPPCREEMPELQAFHDKHHESDGVVIGINPEQVESKVIQAFLDDYFITYPNYVDIPTYKTPLGTVPGLPTTYVISPEGNIAARQVGGVTLEMIENFIEKWEANKNN